MCNKVSIVARLIALFVYCTYCYTVVWGPTEDVSVKRGNVWLINNETICLVLRFILLLDPKKERLFDFL